MKPEIWDQLKNLTSHDLCVALLRDGWTERSSGGSAMIYKKDDRKVSIHSHHHKTYGHKQLKQLFADIGWDEDDLIRLKLVK
jgi:predicted RNA binding protein YcfA (HicA-like mRNA interferase family)